MIRSRGTLGWVPADLERGGLGLGALIQTHAAKSSWLLNSLNPKL